MNWHYTPLVLPLVAAAAITATLALVAARRRHVLGATGFAWLMVTAAGWSLCYALEVASADLPTLMIWTNAKFLGVAFLPVAWFAFALQYSGRERWLTRLNVALLTAVPLVTQLIIWTDQVHHLFRHEFALDTSGAFLALTVTTQGVWFWVHTVYCYLLLVLGLVLLMQGLVRSARLYRGQAISLLIGALVPWVANALYIFWLTKYISLDPTPFAFTVTGLAFAWGLFRFRLLDVVPAARSAIVESMTDGVLVLNAQNHVVDLNPAAQQIIGRTAAQVVGHPLNQVLSERMDLVQDYQDLREAQTEITLKVDQVQHDYDMRLSPLYDRQHRLTGRLIVLRDITERKHAEQAQERWVTQLQVLPEMARSVVAMRDLEELLYRSVNLVRDRLGFYHVGIFLMDERGESATLKAATGEAGSQMLQRGYRARVGEVSSVGAVLSSGQFRSTRTDSAQMQNPLLPETRSELALPIKVGQRVIGALDVHSTQAADFDEMVTVVLQTVADQLAVAIENVRLLQEMQNTLRTMEAVSSRYTQEAWGSLTQSAGRPHGYRYKDQRIEPAMELEPEAQQAWQQSRSVVTTVQPEAGDSRPDAMGALAVPIRVRDQVIGALNIRFKDRQVPSETVSLVQEVADRLALTLESARLYQDTQRRAAREQMTAQITTRIRESLDMQTVLTTAAEQMRQALGLEEMRIQLAAPQANPEPAIAAPLHGAAEREGVK